MDPDLRGRLGGHLLGASLSAACQLVVMVDCQYDRIGWIWVYEHCPLEYFAVITPTAIAFPVAFMRYTGPPLSPPVQTAGYPPVR